MIKPETVIKEILNPPFKMNGLFLLTADQYRKKNKAANKLIKFIESSVDEKWERKFGEPLRWKELTEDGEALIACPKCCNKKTVCSIKLLEATPVLSVKKIMGNRWNYCPSCGIRLMEPEDL